MITPILILHGRLSAAIASKQAIERAARCEVHPFTTPDAAIEYAQEHPQDAAVIDLASLGAAAAAGAIAGLRMVQPEMLIIVVPPPGEELLAKLGADAGLPVDYRPADLLRLIEAWRGEQPARSIPHAARHNGLLQPDFFMDDPIPPPPDTLPEPTDSIAAVLREMGSDMARHAVPDDDPAPDDGATPSDPQSVAAPLRQHRADFDALVNALRQDAPTPGSRMAEFIIRGGAEMSFGAQEETDRVPAQPSPADDAMGRYQQLLRDEPPLPTFQEGGTISELFSGAGDRGFDRVLKLLRGEQVNEESSDLFKPARRRDAVEVPASDAAPPPIPVIAPPLPSITPTFEFDPLPEQSPAKAILERTLQQTAVRGDFSIDELLDDLEAQFPGFVPRFRPMPAHVRDQAIARWRAAREATMALAAQDAALPDQTTRASQAQRFEPRPDLMETERLEAQPRAGDLTQQFISPPPAPPPPSLPEPAVPAFSLETGVDDEWGEWYTEDFNTQFERMAAFDPRPPAPTALPEPVAPPPAHGEATAQMALTLTHAALETTAEAALLLRAGEIIAQAGRMPTDELIALQPAILSAHETDRRDARVQFVTQPDTGRDYLLYTCRTEGGTLTLIFKGTTPMGDIRRQGARLIEALRAVPEVVEPAPPAPLPVARVDAEIARDPLACVWLLRDADSRLSSAAVRAVRAGLDVQLREAGWTLHHIEVSEEAVYVFADVPGGESPLRVVRDLKARSAALIGALHPEVTPDALWADSYLIVTPGRPLDSEEVRQFIDFERMA